MNFKILSAELATVTKEGDNFGKKYVKLVVSEDSMFSQKKHTVVLFVNEEVIPAWEKAIANNTFPTFHATYKTVSCPDIPAYKLKDRDNGKIYTSMTVLVPQTPDGQDRVSAVLLANRTIDERMIKVDVNEHESAPMADVSVPV